MKCFYIHVMILFFLSMTKSFSQEKDSLTINRSIVQVDSLGQRTISGLITDDAGQPLPGAIIVNKTIAKGVQTDFDGQYAVQASKGDTLVVSYIGFKTKEIVVGTEIVIDLELVQDSSVLDEVVIVAYKAEEEEYISIPCLFAKRLFGKKKYDSRFEKHELDSLVNWQSSILKKTESIAVIIEKEKLDPISNEEYQIDISSTLGGVYNLCSDQIFVEQPVVGVGTGFVIGPKSMITAKHVFERSIEDYLVVFGFELVDKFGKLQSKINASNVFTPKRIEKQSEELDVVKFTVDREFDKPTLEWEKSLNLKLEEVEIYMLGHPSGLPLKIALNAGIVDNSPFQYFYTSLDGFQGNSGSPIFNVCTNKVIGVLVSGELDYQHNGNCYETTLCKFPQCKGEKVIRIENIIEAFN